KAILDMSQLAELGAGNPAYEETIADMVRNILDKGVAPMAEARQAWLAGDGKACARILHRLRGEVGNLGAERFVDASRACEQAILEGSEGLPKLLEQAEAELRQVLELAGDWLHDKYGTAKMQDVGAAPVDRVAYEGWK